MLRKIIASASVFGLCQGMALAQSSSSSTSADSDQTRPEEIQTLPQEIKQKLSSQGFTDVQVVPGSYLVSAKDKDGDPVSMLIGPHSMTIMTMKGQDSGSDVQQGEAPAEQNDATR